jgi:hypothetical protein
MSQPARPAPPRTQRPRPASPGAPGSPATPVTGPRAADQRATAGQRLARQPDGRTVLEVTDQAGNPTGLVASTRPPIVSVGGTWLPE